MEDRKAWKIDIDYESYLFDPAYEEDNEKYSKVVKEFEYIYFICCNKESILKNTRSYEASYLQRMQNLGFLIPELKADVHEFNYWWGSRKNFPIEKCLNSKITSATLAQEFSWGFVNGLLVTSLEEIKHHMSQFTNILTWVVKDPHGFSGLGQV